MSLGGTWDASGWVLWWVGPRPGLHCAQIIARFPSSQQRSDFCHRRDMEICTFHPNCLCLDACAISLVGRYASCVENGKSGTRRVPGGETKRNQVCVSFYSQPEFLPLKGTYRSKAQGEKKRRVQTQSAAWWVCVRCCVLLGEWASCREWELVRRRGFYQSANHQVQPKAFRNKGLKASAAPFSLAGKTHGGAIQADGEICREKPNPGLSNLHARWFETKCNQPNTQNRELLFELNLLQFSIKSYCTTIQNSIELKK